MAARGQWYAVGAILVMLAALLTAGLALNSDLRPVGQGTEAPDFRAVDIATGDTLSLDDFRGRVVLLNIWATWCIPCEVEMPSMERLHQSLGPEGLHVVAVSIDAADADVVREWVGDRQLTFDVLHDRTGKMERIYQTTGVPESFVIDRHGTIVRKVIGAAEWDSPTELAVFRRLLGPAQTAATPAPPQDADRP